MDRIKAAFGSFAVDDIETARRFYGRTLGLVIKQAGPESGGPFWLTAGDGPAVFVYPKPDHEPAGFTVLNLAVEDIELAIDQLSARGITMQHLDGIAQDKRGIYRGEGHSIAWFTDPAGNSLSVANLSAMP
jgi:predicted enzyme related to lactoylglutathione lyase